MICKVPPADVRRPFWCDGDDKTYEDAKNEREGPNKITIPNQGN